MPIEMPRGLPFSVDTWSPNSKRKRYHFLTHAHKDHLVIPSCNQLSSFFPIYTSPLTKSLLLQNPSPFFNHQLQLHNNLTSLFTEIQVGQTLFIDDPDSPFSVTAYDANHCPGSVMFLFEGDFGNVLHTGDCRLTSECIHKLPIKYISHRIESKQTNSSFLDYLFLDCTFSTCPLNLPTRNSAIQQVMNCIWKHPKAPVVYLACGLLGQEEILERVSTTFGSKIYVDKTKYTDCFHQLSLTLPHVLSEDPSCRFQVLEGFPRLYERVKEMLLEARANLQPEPLFIRPSAQWYACEERSDGGRWSSSLRGLKEAEKDEFGVWHVCYSMHSSRQELEWALELLQPKWVISTTPPCRAMDLDYVKNHCFSTKITSDDPLWKLLNISTKKSTSSQASTLASVSVVNGASYSPNDLPMEKVADRSQSLPKEMSLNFSPPSGKRPLTLFGRARLVLQNSQPFRKQTMKLKGSPSSIQENTTAPLPQCEKSDSIMVGRKRLQDSEVLLEENRVVSAEISLTGDATAKTEESSFSEEDNKEAQGWSEKSKGDRENDLEKSVLSNGTSKGFNESMRKLYRSMNVPVPRPLPSLVELMGARKRAKASSSAI